MTFPTPDAQPSKALPRRPTMASPNHSIADLSAKTASPALSTSTSSFRSALDSAAKMAHEHAIDFATHSWDLATGGLKTLTAKRELPIRPDRRSSETPDEAASTTRNYLITLIILASVVLMLLGGGVVLLVLLLT